MGFYDNRCMLTGLNLQGIGATLVTLHQVDGECRPITLGISGTYDRLGGIDGVTGDVNTELVLGWFLDRLGDGRFVVDVAVEPAALPIGDIEELLWCFECTNGMVLDFPPVALLDRAPVVFALIAQPVWDALAAAAPTTGTVDEWFVRAFRSPVAGEIYRGRLPEVAEQVRQLAAVNDLMAGHGLRWASPGDPDQRYPTDLGGQLYGEEARKFLAAAERDFAGVPAVLAGLAEYRRQAADLFKD